MVTECIFLIPLSSRFTQGDPRYEVVQDQQGEGLRNVLVIHDADTKDFGSYNCSVVNEYGVARKLIRLNEESELATFTDVFPSSWKCNTMLILHVPNRLTLCL